MTLKWAWILVFFCCRKYFTMHIYYTILLTRSHYSYALRSLQDEGHCCSSKRVCSSRCTACKKPAYAINSSTSVFPSGNYPGIHPRISIACNHAVTGQSHRFSALLIGRGSVESAHNPPVCSKSR